MNGKQYYLDQHYGKVLDSQDGTGAYGSHLTAYLDEMIITKDIFTAEEVTAMATHYATK